MSAIAIMQGRLCPKAPGQLQSFPWDCWPEEFDRARDLGFDAIEWLFDAPRWSENPICSAAGRREITRLTAGAGVAVSSVCAHWSTAGSLASPDLAVRARAVGILRDLREHCVQLGIRVVVLPCLEHGSLRAAGARERTAQALRAALGRDEGGPRVALETDLPAHELAAFLGETGLKELGVCCDLGNATAQGLDPAHELRALAEQLLEVHVKDRTQAGISVPLGTGDTPLASALALLGELSYSGPLVLETPVEDDWHAAAQRNRGYVRKHAFHEALA